MGGKCPPLFGLESNHFVAKLSIFTYGPGISGACTLLLSEECNKWNEQRKGSKMYQSLHSGGESEVVPQFHS